LFGKTIFSLGQTSGYYMLSLSGGEVAPPDHWLDRGNEIFSDNRAQSVMFHLQDFPQCFHIDDDIFADSLSDRFRLFLARHCSVAPEDVSLTPTTEGDELLFVGSIGVVPFRYKRHVSSGSYRFEFPFEDKEGALKARNTAVEITRNLGMRLGEVGLQLMAPYVFYQKTCSAKNHGLRLDALETMQDYFDTPTNKANRGASGGA
jgi:hypothetical protein